MRSLLPAGLMGAVSLLGPGVTADESSRARPAIDAAAPARVETATFALG
jgi:hypothetical protein